MCFQTVTSSNLESTGHSVLAPMTIQVIQKKAYKYPEVVNFTIICKTENLKIKRDKTKRKTATA